MARWRRTNPLALAALVTLFDQPRHPYEIAQTMRQRGHDQSMRLNFGALYSVVSALEREGFIEAVEVERDGKRPERTVYRITDDGVAEARDWLTTLISTPAKQYHDFEAALTLLGAMRPDDVLALLEQRARHLHMEVARSVATRAAVAEQFGLIRLFMIEAEYAEALVRAELAFVEQFASELRDGTFPDLETWRAWSARGVSEHTDPPSRKRST
jgi:DNA-binding PadR family transcriptional regulator